MRILLLLVLVLPAQKALSQYNWTPEERLVLAKCLVAEAPLGAVTEQAVVAHVLVKRWQNRRRLDPAATFGSTVRQYCSIFKTRATARQRWIRGLTWAELYRLPPGARSQEAERYSGLWYDAMKLVGYVETGVVSDPLPRAIHFGNASDHRRVLAGKLGNARRLSSIIEDITCRGRKIVLKNNYYEVLDGSKKLPQGVRE